MDIPSIKMASLNEFIKEWLNPEPFITAHTSGSTGNPKEIKLLKSDMRISAEATNRFFGISSDSILAIPLSMNYIAGKMMAVRAQIAGCKLIELPVSNEIIINQNFDLLSVVPSQIESILRDRLAHKKIKNLLIGGAPLSESLREKILANNLNAYIGYGMTETCSHIALRNLHDCKPSYHAMPGITFTIDDRECLVVNSDSFSWKTLITNDVINLKSKTEFEWLGRADNVINSGGVKIHPEQIERLIKQQLPDISPFYIVGESSPRWGECVAMVIQGSEIKTDQLMDQIRSLQLPQYSYPQFILVVNQLPVTKNGKLRRLPPSVIQTC